MNLCYRPVVGLLTLAGVLLSATASWAAQTVNSNFSESCVNQGGTIGVSNLITDFDNGTFGTESGAPNQSPNIDPYPSTITGGVFDNFYENSCDNS